MKYVATVTAANEADSAFVLVAPVVGASTVDRPAEAAVMTLAKEFAQSEVGEN